VIDLAAPDLIADLFLESILDRAMDARIRAQEVADRPRQERPRPPP
jgi:hypothetical protein